MCGFAGFSGAPNRVLLDRMDAAIFRRGPDQSGRKEEKELSLVHRRLAIIDLSESGRQPMTTEDERFTVVYNGELYNYQELRERYTKEGWMFQTATDTECLLASAALHGLEDIGLMRGIFAFALWDRREKMILFARDRQGIKPLFFAETETGLAFASEIQGVLPVQTHWELNKTSRAAYFTLGYVPGPETLFTGIKSLQPGILWGYTLKERVWSEVCSFVTAPPSQEERDKQSFETSVSSIRELVPKAVQEQLISDRPVGFFLSGGLDSSVILAKARAHLPEGQLRTYTTRFRSHAEEKRFNIDAESAKKTAQFFRTEHTEIEVGAEDVIRGAARLAHTMAQPSLNTTMVAIDMVAERASQDVAVVLSGSGGDEVFAGYERHRRVRFSEPFLKNETIRWVTRHLFAKKTGWSDLFSGKTEMERYFTYHVLPRSIRQDLFGSEMTADAETVRSWEDRMKPFAELSPLQRALAIDRSTWLRDDDFVRTDRLAMAHGLEVRVPWLDDRLVELSMRMKDSSLLSWQTSKRAIRHAFQADVPAHVIQGEKRAWMTPIAKWIRVELYDWAHELLQEAIREHTWLNKCRLMEVWERHQRWERYGVLELWTVIAYQLWWREYKVVLRES
jgi:asparagine synthase (glutamine-hydrolysing)